MANKNPFIWQELVTPDQKVSGEFFSGMFGWTRQEIDAGPFGTYTLFKLNGNDVGGMMNPTPDTPMRGSYWHSYIAVENVESSAVRAVSLGGKLVVAPHDVSQFGRVCVVADPTGALAHLVQPLAP